VLPATGKAQEARKVLLCAFLPARAPDALEGPGQTYKACSRSL